MTSQKNEGSKTDPVLYYALTPGDIGIEQGYHYLVEQKDGDRHWFKFSDGEQGAERFMALHGMKAVSTSEMMRIRRHRADDCQKLSDTSVESKPPGLTIDILKLPSDAKAPHKALATGKIASVSERASWIARRGPNTVRKYTNVEIESRIHLIDSLVESGIVILHLSLKSERESIWESAEMIARTVGLGSTTYWPAWPLKKAIGGAIAQKYKLKKMDGSYFVFDSIEPVLLMSDFQNIALVELAKIRKEKGVNIGGGPFNDYPENWIDLGMHYSYLNAIRIMKWMGRNITEYGENMSLDEALRMTWRGRSG